MVQKRKILNKVLSGSKNIRLDDFIMLIQAFGFVAGRTKGSHRMFKHPDVGELLNLQPDKSGKVKPYQMRQFLKIVEEYDLRLDEED